MTLARINGDNEDQQAPSKSNQEGGAATTAGVDERHTSSTEYSQQCARK
jgi:hypothetical protein